MRLSLRLHKPERGKTARVVAGLSIWLLIAFGIHALSNFLEDLGEDVYVCSSCEKEFRAEGKCDACGLELEHRLKGFWVVEFFRIPGLDFAVTSGFVISVGMAIVFAILTYLFINVPKVADFLIETEVELRKVTWPTRKEFVGSSIVVLVSVLMLGIFVAGVDTILIKILEEVGLLSK